MVAEKLELFFLLCLHAAEGLAICSFCYFNQSRSLI